MGVIYLIICTLVFFGLMGPIINGLMNLYDSIEDFIKNKKYQ